MKVFIDNRTDLPFKVIGEVLDEYRSDQREKTIYNGLSEKMAFFKDNRDFLLEITYRKTRLTVVAIELDIRAKEVDMSDVKFPKLPKVKKWIIKKDMELVKNHHPAIIGVPEKSDLGFQ